jgi:peroxiredoxin
MSEAMTVRLRPAPAIQAARWLNAAEPLGLEQLRGRVVLIEAFQMLCPGCVSHGLPQAQRVRETFREEDVAVIGLHSVFEHHDAQTPAALAAFLHEYRIGFPVAVDEPGKDRGLPRTMAAYGLQGTPTLVLIDRQGRRRAQHFGHIPDLRLGAEIMALIAEREDKATAPETAADAAAPVSGETGCAVPTARGDRPA